MNHKLISLGVLTIALAAQSALGWYQPNQQRWLSRDPLGEPGFETSRSGFPQVLGDGPNSYRFVANQPIANNDSLGLVGCAKKKPCCTYTATCTKAFPIVFGGVAVQCSYGGCTLATMSGPCCPAKWTIGLTIVPNGFGHAGACKPVPYTTPTVEIYQ